MNRAHGQGGGADRAIEKGQSTTAPRAIRAMCWLAQVVHGVGGLGLRPVGNGLNTFPYGRWRFRMQEPIPPYLIALACGALEFRAISQRAGVWAEPSIVAGA